MTLHISPMPPDLYAPEQATVDLLLDLNYGAGLGAGSVINVDVNGKFLHGINLTNESGGAFRGYRISIWLRDLVGGPNQIGFSVIMRSVRKGDLVPACRAGTWRVTLFGTSSVQLPQAAHVAVQPDLDLMVRTGFPYADAAMPTTVWLSDASLLGAGWTFVGRLAQVSGDTLPHLQFAIGGEPPRGSAILIGEAKALPPRVFASAVQAIGEVHRVPYTSFNGLTGIDAPDLLSRLWPLSESPRKPNARAANGSCGTGQAILANNRRPGRPCARTVDRVIVHGLNGCLAAIGSDRRVQNNSPRRNTGGKRAATSCCGRTPRIRSSRCACRPASRSAAHRR